MTRPFIACHKFDLVSKVNKIIESFHSLKLLNVAQTVSFGFERFSSGLYIHLLKNYPTFINHISLTCVKVIAAIDIFQWKSMACTIKFMYGTFNVIATTITK